MIIRTPSLAMRFLRFSLIAMACVVSLVACATQEDRFGVDRDLETQQTLPGMVYDGRNQAVSSAEISLDGRQIAESDVNGRFFLRLSFGTYQIEVHREGYESIVTTLEYSSMGQALHIRMTSLDELLGSVAEQIERRRWYRAQELLSRAYAIEAESPEAIYLEAILFYRTEQPARAVNRLEDLVERGYDDAYVYLLLADLHEHSLGEPRRAVEYLRLVAQKIGNEEISARIEDIEEKMEEIP